MFLEICYFIYFKFCGKYICFSNRCNVINVKKVFLVNIFIKIFICSFFLLLKILLRRYLSLFLKLWELFLVVIWLVIILLILIFFVCYEDIYDKVRVNYLMLWKFKCKDFYFMCNLFIVFK